MRIIFKLLIVSFMALPALSYAEEEKAAYPLFEKIFTNWTAAFNRKDIETSCRLFSKSVVANYQGVPPKNYSSICGGFKKIFAQPAFRYQYRFKLHQVYHEKDLAALRVTWYLRIYEKGKLKSITQDEGIDIFQKNNQGEWQIVNYLGYGKESLINP